MPTGDGSLLDIFCRGFSGRSMRTIVLLTFMSRSGSTFLSSALSEYKDFQVSIETDLLNCLAAIPESAFSDPWTTYDRLGKMSLDLDRIISREDFVACLEGRKGLTRHTVAESVLEAYFGDEDARVYVVKSRGPAWNMDFLAAAIPELKFMHILRDGRAVMNSQFRTKRVYRGGYMASEPLSPAIIWRRKVALVDGFKEKQPERLYEVRFEDAVSDMNAVIQGIYCFFIGSGELERRDGAGAGYKSNIPAPELSLHANVGKAPQKHVVSKWKETLAPCEVLVFEMISGKALQKKGYFLSESGNTGCGLSFVPLLVKYSVLFAWRKFTNAGARLMRKMGMRGLEAR